MTPEDEELADLIGAERETFNPMVQAYIESGETEAAAAALLSVIEARGFSITPDERERILTSPSGHLGHWLTHAVQSSPQEWAQPERFALPSWFHHGYEYQSDFAREHAAQGKIGGRARALLRILEAQGWFGRERYRERILACRDLAKLDRWIARAAVGTSLTAIFKTTPDRSPRRDCAGRGW